MIKSQRVAASEQRAEEEIVPLDALLSHRLSFADDVQNSWEGPESKAT